MILLIFKYGDSMNANNQEVIKYLFRSYSDVSQKAIKDVNDSRVLF